MDTVTVKTVRPGDYTEGCVDADVTITIGGQSFAGSVTLYPDQGRPTVARRHPLGTCGTPLEVWASEEVIEALAAAGLLGIERREVIDTIEREVDAAARLAGL